MPFNSETGAMPTAAPVTIPQGEYCFGATSLDGLKIVSLDPRHSDDEQKRICLIFENQFRDMFARRRFEEIRELINSMIESFPGLWRPVQEREDCVIRAFWDEREYREYQRVHPNSPKPVVWGLPSFSRLFYLMGATYSRELRYSLAHICLLNGYEYEPDHPGLWMAKGNLLSWENRFEEGWKRFALPPQFAPGHRQRLSHVAFTVTAGCSENSSASLKHGTHLCKPWKLILTT